jgi:hypothetical protein
MPSTAITLVPGVNTTKTLSKNEAGISLSDQIRFREGLVEKLGGWTSYYSGTFANPPRALWAWRDFQNSVFLAVGTSNQLAAITSGVLRDITPRVLTSNLTNCFTGVSSDPVNIISVLSVTDASYQPKLGGPPELAYFEDIVSAGGITISGYKTIQNIAGTPNSYYLFLPGEVYASPFSNQMNAPTYTTTSGSSTISVALTGHGVTVGFQYAITNTVNVGGLSLSGAFTVLTVPNANTFTIATNTAAASSASQLANGGNLTIRYSPAPQVGSSLVGTPITATDWSLANYGQLLIACAVGGTIYQYQTNGNYLTGRTVQNSPQASGIIISDSAQQLIAYGGNPATLFDPNFVAWSDTGNITVWLAKIGNQAGSFRIPTGSAVIGAASVASSLNLIWTDVDVWTMQYVGYPIVYGFTKIAVGCGLIAQFAWAKLGIYTFWMSQKRFWVYDGQSVQPLDCPVYDNVFPIISAANAWKIRGGSNSQFNEVEWFFPSTSGSGENDMYVKFNPIENAWDYGSVPRSAWIDQSIAGSPIGASPSGKIYQHETSPNADSVAMTPTFTTGLFQISEGEDIVFFDRIRPDFKFPLGTGTVQVTINTYKYPGDAPVVKGPYSFTQATEYISTRCRGRYISLTFSSSDLNSFWRIGRNQVRFAVDGRR